MTKPNELPRRGGNMSNRRNHQSVICRLCFRSFKSKNDSHREKLKAAAIKLGLSIPENEMVAFHYTLARADVIAYRSTLPSGKDPFDNFDLDNIQRKWETAYGRHFASNRRAA